MLKLKSNLQINFAKIYNEAVPFWEKAAVLMGQNFVTIRMYLFAPPFLA